MEYRDARQRSLKELFSSPMKYSYTAFRQATLLYEDIGKESGFDDLCTTVAGHISIHSELQTLFRQIARKESVGVLVVTCGLRKVWEKVLARNDFSSQITVLGGGRVSSGFVVDPAVKGAIVSRLQNKHLMYVVAAGDSPLDLPMLEKADQAIVVVGDEAYRSKHVDEDLKAAITDGKLKDPKQLLLPFTVSPRLNPNLLPLTDITSASARFSGAARTSK